jgi:hypothetical protein
MLLSMLLLPSLQTNTCPAGGERVAENGSLVMLLVVGCCAIVIKLDDEGGECSEYVVKVVVVVVERFGCCGAPVYGKNSNPDGEKRCDTCGGVVGIPPRWGVVVLLLVTEGALWRALTPDDVVG